MLDCEFDIATRKLNFHFRVDFPIYEATGGQGLTNHKLGVKDQTFLSLLLGMPLAGRICAHSVVVGQHVRENSE